MWWYNFLNMDDLCLNVAIVKIEKATVYLTNVRLDKKKFHFTFSLASHNNETKKMTWHDTVNSSNLTPSTHLQDHCRLFKATTTVLVVPKWSHNFVKLGYHEA